LKGISQSEIIFLNTCSRSFVTS